MSKFSTLCDQNVTKKKTKVSSETETSETASRNDSHERSLRNISFLIFAVCFMTLFHLFLLLCVMTHGKIRLS